MEFETATLRYTYQSLVTPIPVFDYDMDTATATLKKQTEVPGGFDRTHYTSERLMAPASDGTRIPISIVYRKGLKKDGSAPLLLYGYGSYGASVSPTFASNRLPLLDRGIIYAIAHVRGGGEMGEPWRDAGRMMKKMNTFTDFIAAAEHLIAGEVHVEGPAGDPGGERRRAPDGRGDQPAPGFVQGGDHPGAVRGRDQRHARCVAAAHDE